MKEIVRVRYTKQDNGVLVSKEMLGRDQVVTVKIHSETRAWKLVNKQGEVLTEGTGKTLALSKIAIKGALKSLGVAFLDEVREHKEKGVPDEKV